MTKNVIDKTICKNCGALLKNNDVGPCPNCGEKGRMISAAVEGHMPACSGSLGWKHTKEYYEKNRGSQIIVLLFSTLSPLVGLFLAGVPGVILGFIFSFLTYYFGAKAIIKIREITKGGDL